MSLGVYPRAYPDNQRQNKHVESTLVSCLDPGSIPGSSTHEGFTILDLRLTIEQKG